MRIGFSRIGMYLSLFGVVLAVSTGLLAGKARLSPHQLTVLFTGDDWGKYKYCA